LPKFFAGARCKAYSGEYHESHGAILNEARLDGYIAGYCADRRARGAARKSLGPQSHTRPSKG
jgi:hypothetical protein